MTKLVLPVLIVCSLLVGNGWSFVPMPITTEQVAAGWIALFDGQTTFGWQVNKGGWRASQGTLQPEGVPSGRLISTSDFANFELHLEFNAAAQSSGTIILRSSPAISDGCVLHLKSSTESINREATSVAIPIAPDIWCTLDVTVQGKEISIVLDNKQIANSSMANVASMGKVALSVDQGQVKFRNIRLKPLNMESLFNGKDLSAWTDKNANKSRYEVTPSGEIRVLGGEGQLETKRTYGDFILQLECYVNGEGINSGVFYRAISGKFRKIKGYESQIYNLVDPSSPDTPQKYGTGGIYLHQTARKQLAHDREWFAKTIAVSGPHVAVWVNGLQVSDWTDDRPLNDNPRLGTRLKPGVVCLQAHDPTTDVLFRNLQIAEMPNAD